jgi:8-oxo-dGTP pyrophosphatase MutT (NUDIX family)
MDEYTNPWKILSSRQVYDNKWIGLTEYDVVNPGGGNGIYGKVHFKNRAIGVIALDQDHETYLVGQYRFTINEYSWEIPEGGGDMDEDPLAAAKRELLEETGLVAKDWQIILSTHLSNSVSDEFGLIFLARNLEQHSPNPEETEQLMVRKLPFPAAWDMVKNGEITDAMTQLAIQQVKVMILEGQL